MTLTKTRWLILAATFGVLAGCGGEGSPGKSASAAPIGQGLAPGEHAIEVVGPVVRSVGPYSGARDAVRFAPNTYGQSRERRDGTGGRQEVLATNDAGPYTIRMRMDLQREDQEPDRETAAVTIQLPPEARAGQTYRLENTAQARHGEAFLSIMGYGQSLPFGGSGTVSVAELGEHLSVQFEFRGGQPDEDNERHVIGRAYKIPLSRQGEAHYTLVVAGEATDRIQHTRFRNAGSIMVGPSMQFDLGDERQPGRYRLANRPGAGAIGLQLFDHRGVDVGGEIDLERHGDTWSATFQFDAQGETSLRGEGGFDHVTAWGGRR